VENYLRGGAVESSAGSREAAAIRADSRIAVLSLFGMMNWIYTWYNPRIDADAESLARHMGDIFLHGLNASSSSPRAERRRNSRPSAGTNGNE
jgi:hypothetical protein